MLLGFDKPLAQLGDVQLTGVVWPECPMTKCLRGCSLQTVRDREKERQSSHVLSMSGPSRSFMFKVLENTGTGQEAWKISIEGLLLHPQFWIEEVVVCSAVQTMFQDCRKIFVVPSFVIILIAEIIMVVGGSGAGYQIIYFEVHCHHVLSAEHFIWSLSLTRQSFLELSPCLLTPKTSEE